MKSLTLEQWRIQSPWGNYCPVIVPEGMAKQIFSEDEMTELNKGNIIYSKSGHWVIMSKMMNWQELKGVKKSVFRD